MPDHADEVTIDRFDAVVFDKDGTLLDFHATWDASVGSAFIELAAGNPDVMTGMAEAVGYDLTTSSIPPGSPMVAETPLWFAQRVAPWLNRRADARLLDELDELFVRHAAEHLCEASGASALIDALATAAVGQAVATNDAEATARTQIEQLGWGDTFDIIVGFDSGHGAKPEPGMITAAARALGVAPSRTLMVGDTAHDIVAGNAAGATTALVGPGADNHSIGADLHCSDLVELHERLFGRTESFQSVAFIDDVRLTVDDRLLGFVRVDLRPYPDGERGRQWGGKVIGSDYLMWGANHREVQLGFSTGETAKAVIRATGDVLGIGPVPMPLRAVPPPTSA